ncbi:MAG: TonB-dependent receptor [Niabella sp.]
MTGRVLIWGLFLLTSFAKLAAQPSVQYPREPLSQRLQKIATDFSTPVSYDRLQLKDEIAPQINIATNSVAAVLQYSLSGTGFTFKKMGATGYYIAPIPKGVITGLIIDAEEGTALPGATVQIGNTSIAAGASGTFYITLEEGLYDMLLTSIGYADRQIKNIKVKAGSVLNLNLTLQKAGRLLQPVKVLSSIDAERIRSLYACQKQAGVITDGLAAPQIESLPDKSLSQVIKRINGVSLVSNTIGIRGLSERNSQVLIDGIILPSVGLNKRSLALDIFPKEIVNQIILTKTASPDAPTSFSGGLLHIQSLVIPNSNFTSFTLETGANTQAVFDNFNRLGNKGKLDWLGIDDGTRKKPANIQSWQWYNNVPLPPPNDPTGTHTLIPGEPAPYSSLNATAQSKKIDASGLIPSQQKSLPDFNFNFSLARSYALKDSATLGFVLGTSVYQRQLEVKFNNRRRRVAQSAQDSSNTVSSGEGTTYQSLSGTGTVFNIGLKKPSLSITFRNIISTQLKDNFSVANRRYYNKGQLRVFKEEFQNPEQSFLQQHQLSILKNFSNNLTLDYYLAFTRTTQKLLDRKYFQYLLNSTSADDPIYNIPNILYNWRQNNDSNVVDNRTWLHTDEKNYTTGLSFSKGFHHSYKLIGNIKAGWQALISRKTSSTLRLLPYALTETTLTGQYYQLLAPSANNDIIYWPENTNGNIYSGEMSNQAFYIQTNQKLWNRLQLLYGLRAEYYHMQNKQQLFLQRLYDGNIPTQYDNGITGEKNWYLLPSANAVFNLNKKMNLRAAYSKTALHPDFRELSYFGLYESELDGNIRGQQLLTTCIDNYDLRWEWYPLPEEIISFSFFHKKLKNPVELAQAGAFATSYGYINQRAAQTSGIELEIRKSLKLLAPQSFLKNLTLHSNYTANWSVVEVMSYPIVQNGKFQSMRLANQDRPLFNQAPWAFNAGLSYQTKKAGGFAFYNKSGPIAYITHINPNLIEYENGVNQLDIGIYLRCMKDKGRLSLNALNILNPWQIYYTNNTAYRQVTGGHWQLVNGTKKYNAKDGDMITYKIKQGISLNMGLSVKL